MQDALSLHELNALVRRSLEQHLPDEYWVRVELSDVRTNSTGHHYLEFAQKDPRSSNPIAKARGTIQADIYRLLKPYFEEATGQSFISGIRVLAEMTVAFRELYGHGLTVQDIDPVYILGDMAHRCRETLKQPTEEEVLTLNKELKMPLLPQRIVVISLAATAGYGDFCHQLQHNPRGFYFNTELSPVLTQGNRMEEPALAVFDVVNARMEESDVIVTIHGGGAAPDLSGFDIYLLTAACAQSPLPVTTKIKYERNDTVLDSIVHTRMETPVAVAELLINRIEEAADRLEELVGELHARVYHRLEQERRRLSLLQSRTPSQVIRKSLESRVRLRMAKSNLSHAAEVSLVRQHHWLELLQNRIVDASSQKLLKRGYSITLKEGKAVKNAVCPRPGDELVTRLYEGEVKSKIESIPL